MTDKSRFANALFDDLASMASNAAGLAQGARQEFETLFRSRLDRWLASRDFVSREEFDAVREMANLARDENERLAQKLTELEQKLSPTDSG